MSELALDNIREYYIASSRQTALVDKAVRSCPNHALINRQRPTAPGIFGFYSKIEHLTRSASQKHTPTREKAHSLRVR